MKNWDFFLNDLEAKIPKKYLQNLIHRKKTDKTRNYIFLEFKQHIQIIYRTNKITFVYTELH